MRRFPVNGRIGFDIEDARPEHIVGYIKTLEFVDGSTLSPDFEVPDPSEGDNIFQKAVAVIEGDFFWNDKIKSSGVEGQGMISVDNRAELEAGLRKTKSEVKLTFELCHYCSIARKFMDGWVTGQNGEPITCIMSGDVSPILNTEITDPANFPFNFKLLPFSDTVKQFFTFSSKTGSNEVVQFGNIKVGA